MSFGWAETPHFSLVKDFEVNQAQCKSKRIDLHYFHITSLYFLVSHIAYLINLTLFHPCRCLSHTHSVETCMLVTLRPMS